LHSTAPATGNIADYTNCRIRKVTIATGIISTVQATEPAVIPRMELAATSAELNGPNSVAIDSSGKHLYRGHYTNNRLRKVTISTGFISTVAGYWNSRLPPAMGPRRRAQS